MRGRLRFLERGRDKDAGAIILQISRNPTRPVRIGSITIGAGHPIAVQSMTATKTEDVAATIQQVQALHAAGADLVRIAVDSAKDAAALRAIRDATKANLVVDLQENYRLAEQVAPYVDKLRYNPGHLYHHERQKPWQEKVRYLVDIAQQHGCALRVGVNCGSVDPEKKEKFPPDDSIGPMLESAWDHCELLDQLGFDQFCVSLKDSDPRKVIESNRRFAEQRPDVPLHLGVTEAGIPPDGIIKTRIAFEQLISRGIGDTIRVSLTVSNDRKPEEIAAGRQILDDIAHGRVRSVVDYGLQTLNIIACPSCSRVENEAFIELAEQVKEMTAYARDHALTIAVMGCRVNGPGETDDADLGLWCGPNFVNLKRGSESLGAYAYDKVLDRLREELDGMITASAPADRNRNGRTGPDELRDVPRDGHDLGSLPVVSAGCDKPCTSHLARPQSRRKKGRASSSGGAIWRVQPYATTTPATAPKRCPSQDTRSLVERNGKNEAEMSMAAVEESHEHRQQQRDGSAFQQPGGDVKSDEPKDERTGTDVRDRLLRASIPTQQPQQAAAGEHDPGHDHGGMGTRAGQEHQEHEQRQRIADDVSQIGVDKRHGDRPPAIVSGSVGSAPSRGSSRAATSAAGRAPDSDHEDHDTRQFPRGF